MFSKLSSTLLKQGLQELINSWDTLESESRKVTILSNSLWIRFSEAIFKVHGPPPALGANIILEQISYLLCVNG